MLIKRKIMRWERKRRLENLGIEGRITLRFILQIQDGRD